MSKIDLDRDLEIIGKATDGLWLITCRAVDYTEVGCTTEDGQDFDILTVHGDETSSEPDAEYIAHFNPAYTRQLVEALKESEAIENGDDCLKGAEQEIDQLRTQNEYYEAMLEKCRKELEGFKKDNRDIPHE